MTPDYLPIIAEIGAALAGFGGLAGLIGRQGSSESPAVDAGRLRGMLQRCLSVVLFALGQFRLDEAVVWWICAALLFMLSPYLTWSQFFRLRRLPGYAPGIIWFASGQINMIVLLALLGAGFLGHISLAAAYGFALLIELTVAGGQFLRIVASITSSQG